MQIEK